MNAEKAGTYDIDSLVKMCLDCPAEENGCRIEHDLITILRELCCCFQAYPGRDLLRVSQDEVEKSVTYGEKRG